MTEGTQQKASTDAKPIKKRRFFRPKPKAKPMDSQPAEVKQASKSQPLQAKGEHTVENKTKQIRPKQPIKAEAKPISKQQPKTNKPVQDKVTAKATEQSITQAKQPKKSQPSEKKTANKPEIKNKTKAVQVPATNLKKTEKPQLKQATQTAHKAPAKINSHLRNHRPVKAPRLNLKDIDFKYLDNPDFQDIYILVSKAQSYLATDKETCCTKFRIANEAIIERLIADLQLKEAVVKKGMETNYFEQINLLKEKLPTDMVDQNILAEMHNIRMIGNSFAHGDNKYDPAKGSRTCLIAMEKICRWLVDFEPKYKSYQRAKAATSSNIFKDIWNALLNLCKCK